jgi:DNA repair exonuclease SbcCD ATPase subunit
MRNETPLELENCHRLALTRAYVAELALKDHQQQAEEEERKEEQVSEHRLGAAKQAALEARGRAEQAEAALSEQKQLAVELEQAHKLQLEEANQKLKVSKGRADAVQTALVELQAQAQEVGGLLTSRAQEARTALKKAQGRAEQAEAAVQNLKHEVQAAEQARAAAGQAGTASSPEAAGDGDRRHLEQMTLLLRQVLKGRSGAGKQASHLIPLTCPAVSCPSQLKICRSHNMLRSKSMGCHQLESKQFWEL